MTPLVGDRIRHTKIQTLDRSVFLPITFLPYITGLAAINGFSSISMEFEAM
jgi:hypothetical protein